MSPVLTGYVLLILILKRACSEMEGKIVGGTPVSMDHYPSMVQLYNLGNMCAGNILNSWTILTAAHCFDYNLDSEEVVVQVGTRYVYDFSSETYGVNSLVLHEKYNQTRTYAYDIALIFLERPMRFTKVSKKGILVNNAKWMKPNEVNFTATGWGWTKYGGELSKKGLMMTYLRFIPNDECSRMHSKTMTKDMFCLYGEGTRDTCKGDSGGGVMWHGMIVGITSHGNGCARKRKPSVYANVYYFREWIKYHIKRFLRDYCKTPKRPKSKWYMED